MKPILSLTLLALLLSCSGQQKALLPSTAGEQVAQPPYRLQSGDELELIVTQRTDLSGDYTIGPDGTLDLPIAGNIEVRNLTRRQAEQKIESRLKKIYSPLSLMLKIKSFQNEAFYVILGEVEEAGIYPIKNSISLLKAIGMAKGFSEDAAIDDIRLIRNGLEGQVIEIDLDELMHKGDFSQDYILQKDDMIYVPRKTLASLMYPIKQVLPLVQVGLLTLITINQL